MNDQLVDGAGAPLVGQILALTGHDALGQSVQVFVHTASDGSYGFAPVPPGNYAFDVDGSNPTPPGVEAPVVFVFSQRNLGPSSFLNLQTSDPTPHVPVFVAVDFS
jgi:hypothetical protein